MSQWSCYLLSACENNQTYIGSTNNFQKRLKKHNSGKGARRTKGYTWIPVLVIEGFPSKESCLSFESCWKRICHHRKQKKLNVINLFCGMHYRYVKTNYVENRLLDLMVYLWYNYLFYKLWIKKTNLVLPANIISVC